MIVLLQVLAVLAVVFGVAVVLTGRDDGMSAEGPDLADTGVPRDRGMTPRDVIQLRFALAFRGYRMSEVDDALDRLAAELAARDETIASLRAAASPEPARDEPAYVPSDATGELPPGTDAWVPPAPDAGEPDGYEPEFRAPEPLAASTETVGEVAAPELEPVPVPEPESEAEQEPEPAAEEPSMYSAFKREASLLEPPADGPNPFRPEVPDIPTYGPWSVTLRSPDAAGPAFVEVDEHPDEDVEVLGEHQKGHAPAPEPAADDDEPPPPWRR